MFAIVSTSVNDLPSAYRAWAEQSQDVTLIVAGDLNTPSTMADYVRDLGGVYLTPGEQASQWPALSQHVGWRTIQRRNFAILHALELDATHVLTVDDDNAPTSAGYVTEALQRFDHIPSHTLRAVGRDHVFDPGVMCYPSFPPARGLPYDLDRNETRRCMKLQDDVSLDVGVVAGMVLGDPDIDAMERMINNPRVQKIQGSRLLPPGMYAPLNSQCTTWTARVAPLMAVLPGVGRMDDIWGGYIAQWIMGQYGVSILYGPPMVAQRRNEHDLVCDVEAEIIGYRYSGELIKRLRSMVVPSLTIMDDYREAANSLELVPWFPVETTRFMHLWALAVEEIKL